MSNQRFYLIAGLCFSHVLMPPAKLYAQDQTSALRSRLQAAVTATALDGLDIRPWHWKMDVTFYDGDGLNPQSGSVEAWFADGNMRTTTKLADSELTTIRLQDKLYRSAGDVTRLVPVEVMFMHALHPVAIDPQDSSLKLKTVQRSAGKTKLDCIQPTFALPEADTFSGGTPLSYCFQAGLDQLLVTYSPGEVAAVRSRTGSFLGKQVAVEMSVSAFSKKRLELKTTALSTFTPAANEFAVPSEMQPVSVPIEILPKDQLLGLFLTKDPPHYPTGAKARHVEGSAKFEAIIGTDGRISSLRLTNKADSELVDAATKAIMRWTFRPYLVNGVPVKVKTVLTLNFNLA